MAEIGAAIVTAWAAVTATVAAAGAAIASWAAAAGVMGTLNAISLATSAIALGVSLFMKPPGLESAGQQVNLQLAGPDYPLPAVFGETGVQGAIVYRDTYGSENRALMVEQILSVGPIQGVQSFSVMGRALTYSGNPNTGFATVTQVQGVDMRGSKLFRENGLKVHFRKGALNDFSTLSSLTGESVPNIGSSDSNPGLARTLVRCYFDEKRLNFPQGFPDDPISIVRGMLCYDPRLDSTYPGGSGPHRWADLTTRTWSQNPYILALNHALGWWSPRGVMFGMGMTIGEIDVQSYIEGANVADANGWTIGGQVLASDGNWPIMTNALASGGGIPNDRGGKLSCYVRSPKVASFTIREDEVLDSRSVQTSTRLNDRFNAVVPVCRNAANKYEMVAGEVVTVDEWVTLDGGVITEEIKFPLVQNYKQAHQLAAYYACDARETLETEITVKPRALAVEIGDVIEVALPEFQDGQNFLVLNKKWDAQAKKVTLYIRSETLEKHAFCLGQSQVAPSQPVLRPFDPNSPSAPPQADWHISANSLTQVVEGQAATVIPALVVNGEVRNPNVQRVLIDYRRPITQADVWPEGVPSDLTEADIEYEMSEHGWTLATTGSRTATEFVISPLTPQTEFEVSVSFEMMSGIMSRRLILPATTTAQDQAGGVRPGGIDWSAPPSTNPITNVPIGLETDGDGLLSSNNVRYGTGTLLTHLEQVQAQIIDFDGRLANAVGDSGGVLTGLVAEAEAFASEASAFAAQASTFANSATSKSSLAAGYANAAQSNAAIATSQAVIASSNATVAQQQATLAATWAGRSQSNAQIATTQVGYATANASLAQQAATQAAGFRDEAASNASLAQTQVTYATANAALASSNAALAATWAGRAQSNATAAQASAGIATTQAGYATANSATAQTQATLSATRAGYALANATAAQQQATIATNQAVYATSNASAAQTQAGLSATWAGRAQANAVAAQTQAGIATDQAVIATEASASAQTYSVLTASVTTRALNTNSRFIEWPAGQTLPTGWSNWAAATSATTTRVANPVGGYGYKLTTSAGMVDCGISIQTQTASTQVNEYFVIEAEVRLDSGSLAGAGLLCQFYNESTQQVVSDGRIVFNTDADSTGSTVGNGVVGRTYRFAKLIRATTSGRLIIYAMGGWSGFATNTAARSMTFYQASVRPATQPEIAASTALQESSATITSLQSVTQSHTGSLATISTLSRVNGVVSGTISTNNGNTPTFDVLATAFRVTDPNGNGQAAFEVISGTTYIKSAAIRQVSAGAITVGTMTQAMTVGSGGKIVIDGANNRIVISD